MPHSPTPHPEPSPQGEGEISARDRLYGRVITETLRAAMPMAWGMREGEAKFMRETLSMLSAGANAVPLGRIERALSIAAGVRRKVAIK